ncbi:chitin synthase-domain-containing protein [Gongronella butleri]|nr:chitin synthase-domain-containing protein [Gongronella butleri]
MDAIVDLVKRRYQQNQPFTTAGDHLLLSLSADIDHQASAHYIALYKDAKHDATPHLYQQVNHAYHHMRRTNANQLILFRGETASGKTRQSCAAIQHAIGLGSTKKPSKLPGLLQRAFAVVHAFTRAKSAVHDHASHAHLYTELFFSQRGHVLGAQCLPYFVDVQRVSRVPADEHAYHVFYALFSAPIEERQRLGLVGDASSFQYLQTASNGHLRGTSGELGHKDGGLTFHELHQSLRVLGVPQSKVVQLFQSLAAILHLSNLVFVHDPVNPQDAAVIKNMDILAFAADLLGVDTRALANALTYKSKLIKRDVTTVFLDPTMASAQRDALARTIYALVIAWLTRHINGIIGKQQQKTIHSCIAFLDGPSLQGLAAPPQATLRDLSLNFVDEALQATMRRAYGDDVGASSSQAAIDAFIHPSKGLFSIMNARAQQEQQQQQQQQPGDALVVQFQQLNKSNDAIRFQRVNHASMFAIQHYWGSVSYNLYDWSGNEDYVANDMVMLFRGNAYTMPTCNGFLAEVFSEALLLDNNAASPVCQAQHAVIPHHNTPWLVSEPPMQWKHVPTMTDQLQLGVKHLEMAIKASKLWTVLCIKPNNMMLPHSCDSRKVAAQLQTAKLASLVPPLRDFYTAQCTVADFWHRYIVSLPVTLGPAWNTIDTTTSLNDRCLSICQAMHWGTSDFALSNDMVHLSNDAFCTLEYDLRTLEKAEAKRQKPGNGTEFSAYGAHRDTFDGYSLMDDQMSSAVTEDPYDIDDATMTQAGHSPRMLPQGTGKDAGGKELMVHHVPDDVPAPKEPLSASRKKWLILVWFVTWWMPSPFLNWCGGMKRSDVRMAWREKVTLCALIFVMSATMVLFIIFFGPLICPHQDVFSSNELQQHGDKSDAYVAIRGEVFDMTKFAPHHWAPEVIPEEAVYDYAGKDATNLFPVQVSALCDGTTGTVSDQVTLDFQINSTDKNAAYHDFRHFTNDYRPDWYFEQMVYMRRNYRLGFMGYEPRDIWKQATTVVNVGEIATHRQWAILHGDVYDLTFYLMGGRAPRAPEGQPVDKTPNLNFMDNGIVELFRQLAGTDISKHFDSLPISEELRQRQLTCLRNLFFVGKVDTRRSLPCLFSEYFLLLVTGFLCAVILFKFLAALQLGSQREPEEYDKFIVCQVPCYTESEESLRKTIDSIAALRYDDKRKLIFLVCDGMLIGSGNDRPTPRIVLDILGVDPNVDPEPLSFFSLGEGAKQHNMGKVYSGLYECGGHVVPYVVVVKVGAPGEAPKPGNRGKRDSQMILMRFLNKVHFSSAMAPMELEIYHQIKNVVGVNPSFYEFVLMVDADTEVLPDSLNRMVSCFVHDSKIVGLCGETKLANEKDSWVTMIQVYEYYISHFLSKAFESLFGSVTCLPGCFCMYRVRSPVKQQPLLISNQVIDEYAENKVRTLHQKNLLHLGEDRYLTTLILKHFPTHKTRFTPDAGCLTNAPDRWSILLSQRRRWINSTIHNLGELMFLPQLCGFCCFSMRFVVILDLLSTLTMPAIVCYLIYLIYRLVTDAGQVPLISITTLGGVYGLQAIIFILRRKWEHIGWMVVYIMAIPLFSFFMPIYSFWHFDDFSWGNTRVVVGDKGEKKMVAADEGKFDPASIPMKRWQDYENELWETNSAVTKMTDLTATSRRSQQQQQLAAMAAAASAGLRSSAILSYVPPTTSYFHQSPMLMPVASSNMSIYSEPRLSGVGAPPMVLHPSSSVYLAQQQQQQHDPNVARFSYPAMQSSPSLIGGAATGPYGPGSSAGSIIGYHAPAAMSATDVPDNVIRYQVQAITATADLSSITKKQVRDEVSRYFNIDMTPRRDFINQCIEDCLR